MHMQDFITQYGYKWWWETAGTEPWKEKESEVPNDFPKLLALVEKHRNGGGK